MAPYEYASLRISVADGIARGTIDHPPINLFDLRLMRDLDGFGREVAEDESVRVVVVDSANPEFFIAHADVQLIQQIPRVERTEVPAELGFFHALVDRFRTMPKATIVILEGRARGGGSEFVSSFDMRFASLERAVLGQPEVALGIIPGGSGTQRLPSLVGRARALEVILGCGDIDAATAEAWGWVNRALPDGELRPFVDALAARIASFPPKAIAAAKESVDNGVLDPMPGLRAEEMLFSRGLVDPAAIRRMQQFMDIGGQTREVELSVADAYAKLH